MSQEARNALANDSRITYSDDRQKSDLLDTSKTNTYLILFLQQLIEKAGHPILITALNSDHHSGNTYHNPSGRAVDCWHADWAEVGDERIIDVMQAANDIAATGNPSLIEVGLSGDAARCMTQVDWCMSNVFVEDYGDDNEHVHFAVGVPG